MSGLLAIVCTLATVVLHLLVLRHTGLDPVATPVSALSRVGTGNLHSLGLVLFACAHVALAAGLGNLSRGRLWQTGRLLLLVAAAYLIYVAAYFATASSARLSGPDANDPLFQLASVVGVVMGCIMMGLWRRSRWLGLFNNLCFIVWLLLVPTYMLVEPDWLGAYERTVGAVFSLWVAGLGLGIALSYRQDRLPAD